MNIHALGYSHFFDHNQTTNTGKVSKFTDLKVGVGTKKLVLVAISSFACYVLASVAYMHYVNGMDILHAFKFAVTGEIPDGAWFKGLY
jgi:hypothetical protein